MDKGTLCKNHLHTDICASANGEAPARTTAKRFVPQLWSDIHTRKTRTGLAPTPARFACFSDYCLRHSLYFICKYYITAVRSCQ